MHSSRLYSCYFFIFTSSILISIPPSFCAGNEHYTNENKPSQLLNIQAQHPLLLFRVLLPQYEVRSSRLLCENHATRCAEAKSSATCKSGSCSASSSARVIESTVVPAKSPPASIPPPSIAPQPKIADPPTPNSPPPSTPRLPNIAKIPIPSSTPKPEPSSKGKLLMAIAIASAILGIVVISFVIIYTVKRGHLSRNKIVCWERGTRNYPFNEEEMMKNFETVVPKRYAYLEVKKLTNSFKNKLGQGGYGTVYKGKLLDGRLVAVKVLSESKGDGEEFINEVISISRTSHVNIVTLVGFCYERNKRALIYEFMLNGSLDQFIYNKRSSHTTSHLDKKIMFRIAIGIARGLEYLHTGCRTKILHFDIKPHNILLDEDLCPKISDFGLAKLCKRKESIVSVIDMRGTIGYIAPEVFSRNFGVVSHKSDVYSYGMLILEMIGGRKNFDGEISHSSERDFSHWIYAKFEKGKILNTFEEGIEEEEEEDLGKKMILVGLWCIQTNPSDRPSIGKVIEMLEGTLHSLQLPPKPILFSPPRSPQGPSATS